MIRDITLGQFYNTKSFLHRLDPRTKILATICYIISLFLFMNPYVYLAAFLFLIVTIRLSGVPFKFMIRGLKGIAYLILLTSLINIFLTRGEPVFTVWKLTGTREGIRLAVYMVFRFCFLICGSSLLTFTTQPVRLTDGLEKIFAFLRIFKVPVHDMAMMMSIALRFIPILIEETNIIMNAQLSRGADFENGNLLQRAKALLPILVPLFVSSFRRAGRSPAVLPRVVRSLVVYLAVSMVNLSMMDPGRCMYIFLICAFLETLPAETAGPRELL